MKKFPSFSCLAPIGKTLIFPLAILLLLPACGEEKQAAKPKVVLVEAAKKDVPLYMELVGQTIGSVDIAIRARVDGTVEGIHFVEGSAVKKGDPLYTIDSRPFEAKVVEAQGKVAEAKTSLAKAENDLKRVKPLAKINAVSKRDLDAAIAQEGAARASLQAAEAALEFSEIERSYTEIAAPVDGLIGISKAKVGDYVGKEPNPVVLNMISQIDPIHVRVTISERKYLRLAKRLLVKNGEDALKMDGSRKKPPLELILADGSTHTHKGEMHAVDSQIDPSTGTLTLEATFPNPQKLLRPGQYGRIKSRYDIQKDAILIPQRAVQEIQGMYRVYVVNSQNTVELREVTPGVKVESMWVIDKGFKSGERVIVEGLQKVKPDMQVEAVSQQGEGATSTIKETNT